MKRLGYFLLFITSAAVVAYIGVMLFPNLLIFQGEKLAYDYTYEFDNPFIEYFIETDDGEQLNALLFKSKESAEGIIIYFHGNADNLRRWGTYTADFTKLGYDVLVMDYRGYGKSTGTPSEQALYEDARLVWDWSRKQFDYDKWVIYGRSLGSAVASNIAVEVAPDLLVLETPFDKITQEMPGTFLPDYLENQFSNAAHIPQITSKIVIIHGTDDWITRLSSAEKLKPLLKATDEFVIIPEGSHKNLRQFEQFHETLERIL